MTLSINLNRHGAFPLYQQIVEHIKSQISDGRLPAGAQLPTIRQLAADLGVTRLTVQNAYSELQAQAWIESVVGRGTFVSSRVKPHVFKSSAAEQALDSDNVISDMVQLTQVVGVRSMAIADPDPTFFPADEFWACLNRLRPEAGSLLGYHPALGDPVLRVELARLLHERGVEAAPEDILVTGGATQALALAAQALTQPNDTVIIEQPTFLGFLNILKAHRLQPIGVPLDEEGPQLVELERILATHRPRFYYTIPNFHNPTGICMSKQRRRDLLALAEYYNVLLVEDDIYGHLAYGPPPLPLKAEDESGRVLYLSSFSKMLMPGLRIGYLVAPPRLRERLLVLRRATDLCGPPFVQRALANFLHDGGLKRHLARVLAPYQARRDSLLEALQLRMPADVTWTRPEGGFSCWLSMPRRHAPGELYQLALEHGFAFAPGEAFLIQPTPTEQLRLCFSNQSPTAIHSGVEFLAGLIQGQLEPKHPQRLEALDWDLPV